MNTVYFKKLDFHEYGWYACAEDDVFILGDSYPHEGGELYRGEFKEDKIPYLNEFKRDCSEAYDNAVKYFNSRPKNKTYKFAVSLCGGWCGGTIEVKAKDDDKAYTKAQDYVVERLVQAFPTLSIDYDVECENPDFDEDEVEQDMETCPICGAEIDPNDGEDNGYGEPHLYWKCEACGSRGKAIIDQHHDNAFIGHEVD